MTTPETAPVEVTQADRDAAAAYLRGVYGTHAFDSLWAPTIARGAADWHAIVALVVAVRTDTEARLTPRQDGLREALVSVPRKPTQAMYEAAFESSPWDGSGPIRRVVDEVWDAMLDAALSLSPDDGEGK